MGADRTDFNPRSPHGERPATHSDRRSQSDFNPRSPHGERRKPVEQEFLNLLFQPTLPARGATFFGRRRTVTADFNPRSPHGERRRPHAGNQSEADFNPRSPHGERPSGMGYMVTHTQISTHAPRTGSDFNGG